MYIIAIDPGLKTSGTGIAVMKESGEVLSSYYIEPNKKDVNIAARHVVEQVQSLLETDEDKIVVEESFYQGKANKMHQRFIGVLDYELGLDDYIAPTSVKKWVTGSGKATKDQIKDELLNYYRDREDYDSIANIIWDQDDCVDAVAIGLAYLRRELDNEECTK